MNYINAMAEKIFVDTNILVYAHDLHAGKKQAQAKKRITDLWENRLGVLSLQVLQEFYVTLTQKIKSPITIKEAKDLVEQYSYWEVVSLQTKDLLEAIHQQQKYRFSFWDSLIIQAALMGECSSLLSEDFQHNQKVGPLTIINPFFDIQ